ncbi:hypothetical protein [Epilithonimonas arachidiradicis]|uniref:Uncharacterized protein n=1 Tax=Epilithonimonas arachidiradicis TaxID=1617282 RepID=A0A420D8I5_9FLAO|nr:hypothetical protein [Epilithonimonas arachidiradicis]RKE87167.1 hypothetical protein BXY58_2038 [Epilithonimonas arachidiradicis]GGG58774.1 hypothetical protein GCM10007332_20620 [Epilithonimonas arachidiradicis]
MKIINQYPVLSNLVITDDNNIEFEFLCSPEQSSVFVVTIYGFKIDSDNLVELVEVLKKYHLDRETVLIEEDNCIQIFSGNIEENPDAGDWSSYFGSFGFENYKTEIIKKN